MRYLPLTGGATYQPVSLADFAAAVHIDEAENAQSIEMLIASAVEVVERAARRCIGLRDLEFITPGGCWVRWYFPVAPLVSVLGVAVEDDAGDWQDVPTDHFRLRRPHDEPYLLFDPPRRNGRGLRVQARVGHDGAPDALQLRQAVILLTKEWHDAGITASDMRGNDLSMGAHRLIRQVRYVRPLEVGP